jgi:hypothetical protein
LGRFVVTPNVHCGPRCHRTILTARFQSMFSMKQPGDSGGEHKALNNSFTRHDDVWLKDTPIAIG